MTPLHANRTVEPHAEFRSPDLGARLKPWYDEALKRFGQLPSLRLLCYFDNENPEWLQRQYGGSVAIHTPIIGGGAWPQYVERFFLDSYGEFAYDNLIYVPGTSYTQEQVSFLIALAHELQHFVQFGTSRTVLEANNLLYQHVLLFDPTTQLKPWQLPHNREALIVAIRLAKAACGEAVVTQFIDNQIKTGRERNNSSMTQMWEWARTISPSAPDHDLLRETDALVQRYRGNLLRIESGIDFSASNWWEGTVGKG